MNEAPWVLVGLVWVLFCIGGVLSIPPHDHHKRRGRRNKIEEPINPEDLAGAAGFSIKGTCIALWPLLIALAVLALIFLALLCAKDLSAYPPIFTHFHPYP